MSNGKKVHSYRFQCISWVLYAKNWVLSQKQRVFVTF